MKLEVTDKERFNKMNIVELVETLNTFCHNDYATKYTKEAADYITWLIRQRLHKKGIDG